MAALIDVMAYLISKYPANMRAELSNARLTKMVYLSDWRHALENKKQITTINWYFDNYGPFVHDIQNEASAHPELFEVVTDSNMYGQKKVSFSLKNNEYLPNLQKTEKAAIDHIISVTHTLYWNPFIKLVYSTHPIASSERYTFLDLIAKAEEYKRSSPQATGKVTTVALEVK